jgi:NMD protein affecting ribosome stability and mRNA decay
MSGKDGDVSGRPRRDRLIRERVHDTYMSRSKPVEPTVCPRCGVVFAGGRWRWQSTSPAEAHQSECPACQRIRDGVPAGFLILGGAFLDRHREEIMNLVRNTVEEQKTRHPMKRIMKTEEGEGETVISFTDIHLPQGVGQAVRDAYEGELDVHYGQEGTARVYWRR